MNKFPIIIEIPLYIREVEMSKSQRTLYYEWDGNDIRARASKSNKGKKIFARLIGDKHLRKEFQETNMKVHPSMLGSRYSIAAIYKGKFIGHTTVNLGETLRGVQLRLLNSGKLKKIPKSGLNFYVYDKTKKELITANPTQAGRARTVIINGQDFFNAKVQKQARGKVMQAIKQSFLPYVQNMPVITDYPIKVSLYIYDTVKNSFDTSNNSFGVRWDIGNRSFPYGKAFMDLITTGKTGEKNSNGNYKIFFDPKVQDDHRLYVTKEPTGGEFIPLQEGETEENRKLVFVIELDDKPEIRNNLLYKKFHKWE